MTWKKYLTDITLAGGLAGGFAAQVLGGCSSNTGGATTGIPACNANPDPCCICSMGASGEGGYGGAACVGSSSDPTSCQSAMDCAAAPSAACCKEATSYSAAAAACTKALGPCSITTCATGETCDPKTGVCSLGSGSGGMGGSSATGGSATDCTDTPCPAGQVCVTNYDLCQGAGGCVTSGPSTCHPIPAECSSPWQCDCVAPPICAPSQTVVVSCTCDATGCKVSC